VIEYNDRALPGGHDGMTLTQCALYNNNDEEL
jgi:hypothetical protein